MLSAEPASPIDPSKHRAEAASLAGMSSLLVVDDEPGIRNFLQRGLCKHFSLVETAGDVEAADELLQRLTGLCADGRDPPAGAQGHEAGPGPG